MEKDVFEQQRSQPIVDGGPSANLSPEAPPPGALRGFAGALLALAEEVHADTPGRGVPDH